MKYLSATAVGLSLMMTAGAAQAQTAKAEAQAAQPAAQVSAKAKPAILELQKAVLANDTAKIPGALAAAKAVAQTNDDRWMIAGLQMKAALAAKDYAGMSTALDAIVASGHATPEQAAENYKTIASQLYNVKDYAGAAAQFAKAVKANPNDSQAVALQGQALLLAGQKAEAAALMQRAIAAAAASGRKLDETSYRVAVQSAFEANSPAAVDLAQQWLQAYPSADSWRNSLLIYRSSANLDEDGRLALLRLTSAVGGLKTADDYNNYISGLLLLSNFNEAHAVLDQALAANVLTSSSAEAAKVNAKPVASAADLAAAAKTAQSGTALLRIGDRLYGIGEYAKAADIYRQAKAKGVDGPTADLFTGIALARAGDKAGARAALSGVTGARAGLAKYWLLYLDQHA